MRLWRLCPDGVFEWRNSVLFVCGFSLWIWLVSMVWCLHFEFTFLSFGLFFYAPACCLLLMTLTTEEIRRMLPCVWSYLMGFELLFLDIGDGQCILSISSNNNVSAIQTPLPLIHFFLNLWSVNIRMFHSILLFN